ncbi:putative BTB/POZ domain-containing protein At2g40440 [Eutrema salsugineum]|nr:putative BTB/POZ domain-containing protein At2g40440 [Eutrema salsugineum]
MTKETGNKMDFFGGLMEAFKEQRHVDVWLKAGDQTDAIPAHKLILAARSKVFRNILEADDRKASSKETITLSEMTKGELETFLEFMYNGSLPDTKLVQHVHSLYLAAEKYEIPYLQATCRSQIIDSIDSSSAFDVLDLAEIHSDEILEGAVSEFISSNMEEIAFSSKFLSFVESNPALTVQTIRDHFDKLRNE